MDVKNYYISHLVAIKIVNGEYTGLVYNKVAKR